MKRVLVVRTDRVGDVVMITPIVREIKKAYPDAFIGTLTQPNTKSIFLNNPYVDVCIADDLKKESFKTVISEIKKYKFTDALLVHPTERAAYQLFLAGIRNRIGVGRKLYEVITFMKSVSRNNYIPLRHEADYCMDLARRIGVVTNNIQPEIFVTEREKLDSKEFLKKFGIKDFHKKILIHTGTRGSAPNWSEQKYSDLIKTIFDRYELTDYKIILTAYEMTESFKNEVFAIDREKIVDVSHELNGLRELIVAISLADIFICSSTGPIHLADALDKRCIGLHCHRDMNCSKHWGVLNKHSINLEVSEEDCQKYCSSDRNNCGIEKGLPIENVLKELDKFLKLK